MRRLFKNKKGFSLIEIIVAVAIMVVLTAILVPSFLHYLNDAKVQKDTTKFDSVSVALKTTLGDDEIRRYIEKNYKDEQFTLTFDIDNGHIDFAAGVFENEHYTELFKDSKIGLNTYQSIGTEYQMEQTKSDGTLIYTLVPKRSNTTVSVTYELLLDED